MSTKNSEHLLFYKQAIQKYGLSDVRSLHWNSQKTQYIRFKAFTQQISFYNSTILDLGCGKADLYEFLLAKNEVPYEYVGIDFVPEFISYAQKKYPSLTFFQGDFFTQKLKIFDYIICNGALNIKKENNLAYLKQFITHFYPYFKKVFIITLLRYAKGYLSNPLIYNYSVEEVRQVLDSLSLDYSINRDYANNDFMLVIRKKE